MTFKNIIRKSLLLIFLFALGCNAQQSITHLTDNNTKYQFAAIQSPSGGKTDHLAVMAYDGSTGTIKIEFRDQYQNRTSILKANFVKAALFLPGDKLHEFHFYNPYSESFYRFSIIAERASRHDNPSDVILARKDWLKNLAVFKLKVWIPIENKIYPIEFRFPLIITAQKYAETRVACINNRNSLLRLIADEFKVDQILDDPIDLKELGNILTSYLKPYFMLQRAALPKVKTLSD